MNVPFSVFFSFLVFFSEPSPPCCRNVAAATCSEVGGWVCGWFFFFLSSFFGTVEEDDEGKSLRRARERLTGTSVARCHSAERESLPVSPPPPLFCQPLVSGPLPWRHVAVYRPGGWRTHVVLPIYNAAQLHLRCARVEEFRPRCGWLGHGKDHMEEEIHAEAARKPRRHGNGLITETTTVVFSVGVASQYKI